MKKITLVILCAIVIGCSNNIVLKTKESLKISIPDNSYQNHIELIIKCRKKALEYFKLSKRQANVLFLEELDISSRTIWGEISLEDTTYRYETAINQLNIIPNNLGISNRKEIYSFLNNNDFIGLGLKSKKKVDGDPSLIFYSKIMNNDIHSSVFYSFSSLK